jgi:cytochrome c peroxidase
MRRPTVPHRSAHRTVARPTGAAASTRCLLGSLAVPLLVACGDQGGLSAPAVPVDDAQTPPMALAPARQRGNAPVAATVGVAVSHDVTQGGTTFSGGTLPLAYSARFLTDANGLTLADARLVGAPQRPGVVRAVVEVRDAQGRTAVDTVVLVAFAMGLASPVLPTAALAYADARVVLPAHIRQLPPGAPGTLVGDNTPATNPITDAGATLGRVLFHDRRLSVNDQVACASCHLQQFGFSDTAQFSRGFAGGRTGRHSMALANARIYPNGRFFWDERAPTLEAQVLLPIQDGTEMGMRLDDLVAKLRLTPFYAPLFEAAFGTTEVTSDRIARALAQFVRALVPTDSRFDRAVAAGAPVGPGGPPALAGFTAQEQLGHQLYGGRAGCARCHGQATQVMVAPANNGLDAQPADAGAGQGRFKAPSLRNVAVRPPYMHDGRFRTLEEVVAFYDSGVRAGPGTDPRLLAPGGQPVRLGLSAAEREALVAFLRTLTDPTFLADPRFASPFPAR